MIAVRSGNTLAARSRKVSGVSGWKFAALRSRSTSYFPLGVILAMARGTARSAASPARRISDLRPRGRDAGLAGIGTATRTGLVGFFFATAFFGAAFFTAFLAGFALAFAALTDFFFFVAMALGNR